MFLSKHHGECLGCLTDAFLRPVLVFPGFAGPDCAVAMPLCLWCRVGWRDDKWAALVTSFLHDPRRNVREIGQWAWEWATRTEATPEVP